MAENDVTNDDGKDNLFYSYADNFDNPRRLTTEQVRSFAGLENISEEVAQQIIDGLYKLTIITYKKFKNGNRAV